MRIIPVLDLRGGSVVRAIAGRRSEYRPLVSPLCPASDPVQLAGEFARRFRPQEFYLADLDALEGRPAGICEWSALASFGPRLWIDAGIRSAGQLEEIRHSLAARSAACPVWILALESLPDRAALHEAAAAAGAANCAFSLDLEAGRPRAANAAWRDRHPEDLAAEAVAAGLQRVIVLDLAQVGGGRGTGTLELCRRLRKQFPALELVAGGGVRDAGDLQALAAAGCDAALLATALHAGRLSPCGETGEGATSLCHRAP